MASAGTATFGLGGHSRGLGRPSTFGPNELGILGPNAVRPCDRGLSGPGSLGLDDVRPSYCGLSRHSIPGWIPSHSDAGRCLRTGSSTQPLCCLATYPPTQALHPGPHTDNHTQTQRPAADDPVLLMAKRTLAKRFPEALLRLKVSISVSLLLHMCSLIRGFLNPGLMLFDDLLYGTRFRLGCSWTLYTGAS